MLAALAEGHGSIPNTYVGGSQTPRTPAISDASDLHRHLHSHAYFLTLTHNLKKIRTHKSTLANIQYMKSTHAESKQFKLQIKATVFLNKGGILKIKVLPSCTVVRQALNSSNKLLCPLINFKIWYQFLMSGLERWLRG